MAQELETLANEQGITSRVARATTTLSKGLAEFEKGALDFNFRFFTFMSDEKFSFPYMSGGILASHTGLLLLHEGFVNPFLVVGAYFLVNSLDALNNYCWNSQSNN